MTIKREELDDASFTAFRKKLLREKGSPAQVEFLESLKDSDTFSQWMKERVEIEAGEPLGTLDEKLTESDYKDMTLYTEKNIFRTWESIIPAEACRSTFWGLVTWRHIEKGIIDSYYLAANNKSNEMNGRERIERVLHKKSKGEAGADKEIDDIVRTALRRLSGLKEAEREPNCLCGLPFGAGLVAGPAGEGSV